MATRSTTNPSQDESMIDQAPLLGTRGDERGGGGSRRIGIGGVGSGLRGAAQFIRQASSRRVMREPSMIVREAATEHLEERRSEWAYSKPVVVLDMMWNSAFVIVAAVVLFLSREEIPSMPLRLWILGYVLQCVLHMVCVSVEYRKRQVPRGADGGEGSTDSGEGSADGSSRGGEQRRLAVVNDIEGRNSEQGQDEGNVSAVKHLESANTMFSFIWWIVGFYWVSAGGQALTHDSPQLYWLCIVFLAFDVFFVVFCVALACVVGIAVCCCLPCIIAILYAVADQEGASDEDICQLPKYKFRKSGLLDKLDGEISGYSGGIMTECGTETPNEHVLSAEDSECCICLSAYDDGAELCELPCNHHFHSSCIVKWLYINATCPLCKYNIIKNGNRSRDDV